MVSYQKPSLNRDRPSGGRDSSEATPAKRTRGMKFEYDERNDAFMKLIAYVEEECEEYLTLKQCQEKMKNFTDDPYTTKWLKRDLFNTMVIPLSLQIAR